MAGFRFRVHGLVGLGAFAVALIAGGCASSGSAVSARPFGTVAPGTGTKVTVGEIEYKMLLNTHTFTAGAYTFTAVDNGKIPHALEIDGPGVHDFTGTIEPGQSASISVALQPGKYDVFCPIPGHKALGMNTEITVTGASSPPSAGSLTTSAPAAITTGTASSGNRGYDY